MSLNPGQVELGVRSTSVMLYLSPKHTLYLYVQQVWTKLQRFQRNRILILLYVLKIPFHAWGLSEVHLSAFIYRLFHKDFSSIIRINPAANSQPSTRLIHYLVFEEIEEKAHETVCEQMQINQFLKSLCIKLSIEHSTTCDSRTHLNCITT